MSFIKGHGTRGANNPAEGAAEGAEQEAFRGQGEWQSPEQRRLRGTAGGWGGTAEYHPAGNVAMTKKNKAKEINN